MFMSFTRLFVYKIFTFNLDNVTCGLWRIAFRSVCIVSPFPLASYSMIKYHISVLCGEGW